MIIFYLEETDSEKVHQLIKFCEQSFDEIIYPQEINGIPHLSVFHLENLVNNRWFYYSNTVINCIQIYFREMEDATFFKLHFPNSISVIEIR